MNRRGNRRLFKKVATLQTTCEGCRFNRAGRCQDRSVYGKDGGDLLTDDGRRLCYEKSQTLVEGLSLYLLEHEGTKV